MKLQLLDTEDILKSDDFESLEMVMDTASLSLAIRALYQYSNPIGSIVREIASNAYDANVESGSSAPFEVIKRYVDGNRFIVFKDSGIGIDPDRIKYVYRKFYASTKRDTNKYLGAYGLGAKSPLSHVSSFTVVTRCHGKEFTYLVYRAENWVPKIDLIDTKSYDGPTGTEVILPITGSSDWSKFVTEVRSQLKYFDNVEYVNMDLVAPRIVRGKHFIFNAADPGSALHICLGKVYYPLNTDLVEPIGVWGINKYVYNLPSFGLRFEIGDLPVMPNRESIEYTEEVIEKIKKKMIDARQELQDIADSQKEDIVDLAGFVHRPKSSTGFKLGPDIELKYANVILNLDFDYGNILKHGFPSVDTLIDFSRKGTSNGYITISNSQELDGRWRNFKQHISAVSAYTGMHFYHADEAVSTRKSRYIYHEIEQGEYYIVRLSPVFELKTKQEVFKYLYPHAVPRTDSSFLDCLWNYIQEVEELVKDKCKSYDDVEVPENYKVTQVTTKKHNTYPHYYAYRNYNGNYAFKLNSNMTLDTLHASFARHHVIYGFIEDRENLLLAERLSHLKAECTENRRIHVVRVSKELAGLIAKTKPDTYKFTYVSDFLFKPNSFIRRLCTCNKMEEMDHEVVGFIRTAYNSYNITPGSFILSPYLKQVSVLGKYLKQSYTGSTVQAYLRKLDSDLLVDQPMLDLFRWYADACYKYPELVDIGYYKNTRANLKILESLRYRGPINPILIRKAYEQRKSNQRS